MRSDAVEFLRKELQENMAETGAAAFMMVSPTSQEHRNQRLAPLVKRANTRPMANPCNKKRSSTPSPAQLANKDFSRTSKFVNAPTTPPPYRPKSTVTPTQSENKDSSRTQKFLNASQDFSRAIVTTPVEEFFDAGSAEEWSIPLWKKLCDKLKAPFRGEQPIKPCYDLPWAHFELRKSLVIEEAREAICKKIVEQWAKRTDGTTVRLWRTETPLFLLYCNTE